MQEAVAVEAYEWVDTTSLGEVAANLARAQLLVTLFDGDPDKWIDFIESRGTADERERDLPFAQEVKRQDKQLIPSTCYNQETLPGWSPRLHLHLFSGPAG